MSIAYKNVLQYFPARFIANSTMSSIVNCASLPYGGSPNVTTAGAFAARRLIFPSAWITASINFYVSEIGDGSDFTLLCISDGTLTTSALTIPNCQAGKCIVMQPYWFDSVGYFQIRSSATQTAILDVSIAMQPIYQAIA